MSSKETAYRYRDVVIVTPFCLSSTNGLHLLQNQGKRNPRKNWNAFVVVFGEPLPKLKGHMKKCMFKIIVEGGWAMLINRRREMLPLNFEWDLGQGGHSGLESEGKLQACDAIKRMAIEGVERKVLWSECQGWEVSVQPLCVFTRASPVLVKSWEKDVATETGAECMEDSCPLCMWLHRSV